MIVRGSRSIGAAAIAACCAVAALSAPTASFGFSLVGGSLGVGTAGFGYQRDFRVLDNSADATAHDNLAASASHPGASGATLAIWKGAAAWNSDAPGGAQNFDWDFQGGAPDAGNTNGNVVSFGNTPSCQGGTLAYTETPIQDGFRIVMCDNWTWSDGPGAIAAGQYDIQGIVAHELGHALGLGHSNANCGGSCGDDATMCAYACGDGTSARTPENDDRSGLAAVYGAIPADKPRITSLAGSTAIGGELTIAGTHFPATVNVKFTAGTTQNVGAIPGVVYGVASSQNGTVVKVVIPPAAQDGNVLVWVPASGLLSNPFPIHVVTAQIAQLGALVPPSVAALGGATITLTGSHLQDATAVHVGGTTLGAGQFQPANDSTLTFAAPVSGALGPAAVTVDTPAGASAPLWLGVVETSPLTLLGPASVAAGGVASYRFGGAPGRASVVLLATAGTTIPFAGAPMLAFQWWLPWIATDAAGLGAFAGPVAGAPPGLVLYVQVLTFDPANPSPASVALSNVVATAIL